MRAEQADVVIIGAGLAGSAAARALASRGRSVVLLEAFQPGHRRGSSHGSARIFRRAYPDPLYVRLTGQAQVLWRQLADEAGEEFVTTTGAVDYGPARMQEKMHEILTGFGVPAELMPAGAAAERWPGMSFGPDPVMFHPDGGVIDPERAMAAMRAVAAARGAQVCYGAPVLRVEAGADGRDGAHGGPVVARAGGGGRRRGVAGAAARRAGAAAAAGRDPGGGLPLRPAGPRAVARVHLLRRGRHVRPACRTGRRGAWRGQGRRSTAAARSPPGTTATGSSARRPGTGPAISSGIGCPAWTPRRSAR